MLITCVVLCGTVWFYGSWRIVACYLLSVRQILNKSVRQILSDTHKKANEICSTNNELCVVSDKSVLLDRSVRQKSDTYCVQFEYVLQNSNLSDKFVICPTNTFDRFPESVRRIHLRSPLFPHLAYFPILPISPSCLFPILHFFPISGPEMGKTCNIFMRWGK